MNRLEKLPTEVVIYTDGGAEPNPGPGGWGAILLYEDAEGKRHEREIKGHADATTNNRMEILAMLEGLRALKRPANVTVYTDSQYLKNSIGNWDSGKPIKPGGWIVGWRNNGWDKKTKGPLKNVDLWKELWSECEKQKRIHMRWIKGHSGDHYNERCDILAYEGRTGRTWEEFIHITHILDVRTFRLLGYHYREIHHSQTQMLLGFDNSAARTHFPILDPKSVWELFPHSFFDTQKIVNNPLGTSQVQVHFLVCVRNMKPFLGSHCQLPRDDLAQLIVPV
jgi:ribonuclease HI